VRLRGGREAAGSSARRTLLEPLSLLAIPPQLEEHLALDPAGLAADPSTALHAAMLAANEELHASDIDDSLSGTTACVALIQASAPRGSRPSSRQPVHASSQHPPALQLRPPKARHCRLTPPPFPPVLLPPNPAELRHAELRCSALPRVLCRGAT
jgi:hypothetical protein